MQHGTCRAVRTWSMVQGLAMEGRQTVMLLWTAAQCSGCSAPSTYATMPPKSPPGMQPVLSAAAAAAGRQHPSRLSPHCRIALSPTSPVRAIASCSSPSRRQIEMLKGAAASDVQVKGSGTWLSFWNILHRALHGPLHAGQWDWITALHLGRHSGCTRASA